MIVEYMDPLTGEVCDEWREGCLEIELPSQEVERQPDAEWLPEWYSEKLLQLQAQKEIRAAQYRVRMEELEVELRALKFRWEQRLETVVREQLPRGKKSVNYEIATAGFRKTSEKREVHDKEKAVKWAAENCPEAIKHVMETRLLKSFLPKGEEVPGTEIIPPGEKFFVRFPKT